MGIKSATLRTVDVEELGDTAFKIGRAELAIANASSPTAVIWKREEGVWKWHVDIWNPVS